MSGSFDSVFGPIAVSLPRARAAADAWRRASKVRLEKRRRASNNGRREIYEKIFIPSSKTIDRHAHWFMFNLSSVTRAVRSCFDIARNEGNFCMREHPS